MSDRNRINSLHDVPFPHDRLYFLFFMIDFYDVVHDSFEKSPDRSVLAAVFKPEELRQALMPTLEALYRQDPESLPFRQPVDPMLLGIPVSTHVLMYIHLDSRTPLESLS
jgi:hypothetical protein